MLNMQRVRRGVFVTLLLAVTSVPAHAAEPLTLFLLKMLRDQIATSVLESAVNSASRPVAPPAIAPALAGVHGVDEDQLRGLIDAGFVHLTPAQRAEVYASLTRMLADPKNALARPLIIERLAQQASAVRGAHEQLALLSEAQKRAIVADARAEYERLKPEERDQLVQLLQSRVAPIPRDLNDLMLAAFTAP
ncbi:MAG: hypothetical protein KIT13_10740 [Burkholderiales bacterium]|nr:hypothetical protein [Burkholderiales bacterium]